MAAEEEGEGFGELCGEFMIGIRRKKERRQNQRDEGEDFMIWSSTWSSICTVQVWCNLIRCHHQCYPVTTWLNSCPCYSAVKLKSKPPP